MLSCVLCCVVVLFCVMLSHVECHPVVHSQLFLLPLVALCSPALCVHPSMMSLISFASFTIICSKGDSFVLSCVVLVLSSVALPCFALPCLALPCLVLLCLVFLCLASSLPCLLCLSLPHLVLPYITLSPSVSLCLRLSLRLSLSLSIPLSLTLILTINLTLT